MARIKMHKRGPPMQIMPASFRRRVDPPALPSLDDIPPIKLAEDDKVTLVLMRDMQSTEVWSVDSDELHNFIKDCMRSKRLRGHYRVENSPITVEQFLHRYISCWANTRISICFRDWLITRKRSIASLTSVSRLKPLALCGVDQLHVVFSYNQADDETRAVWNLKGLQYDREDNKECAEHKLCSYAHIFAELNGPDAKDDACYDPEQDNAEEQHNVVPADPYSDEEEEPAPQQQQQEEEKKE